jgi:hypothetical protein
VSNNIVTVQASVTVAPTPSALQQSGAFISQGGTTLTQGTFGLITQPADLTAIIQGTVPLASLSSSGAVATATLESTTVVSGTYNTTTGLVTLTLTASIGAAPGVPVDVTSITGTGSVTSAEGTFTAGVGSSGTTLAYTIATGLTMTISGGAVEGTIGLDTGATFLTTIAGASPSGYNGTFLATVASADTFTYTVPSGLSTPATGTPTFTPANASELQAMSNTFFAQGKQQAVWVLELGAGTPAEGVSYLSSWITANPGVFYAYLVPRSWASETTYPAFVAEFEGITAKTYFFTTVTLANYTDFTDLMKSVFAMIEAPTVPVTEFSVASAFFQWLVNAPAANNMMTPFPFRFLFGVTPYPVAGNSALFATLKAAAVNWVSTGAEGGISNAILKWGTTMDGNQANYWYDVDWAQIVPSQALAAAVINGSNNPLAPLLYNQQGINTLQAVAAGTLSAGVSFGVILGQVIQTQLNPTTFANNVANGDYAGYTVINAVPFTIYNQLNPDDYAAGKYNGIAIAMTPQLGFTQIIFNLDVVQFA